MGARPGQMRIIAGSARGRRIYSVPKAMNVRPISARIRQSVFDMLKPWTTGSYFLDLFAGTGAVGIEALSRGAQRACFVERDSRCLQVIEKNLERLGFAGRSVVLRGDALDALSWVAYRAGVEMFDVIFMGPPYKDDDKKPLKLSNAVLRRVVEAGLLAEGGRVVVQHHQNEESGSVPGLENFRREKYGDTRVTFYKRA